MRELRYRALRIIAHGDAFRKKVFELITFGGRATRPMADAVTARAEAIAGKLGIARVDLAEAKIGKTALAGAFLGDGVVTIHLAGKGVAIPNKVAAILATAITGVIGFGLYGLVDEDYKKVRMQAPKEADSASTTAAAMLLIALALDGGKTGGPRVDQLRTDPTGFNSWLLEQLSTPAGLDAVLGAVTTAGFAPILKEQLRSLALAEAATHGGDVAVQEFTPLLPLMGVTAEQFSAMLGATNLVLTRKAVADAAVRSNGGVLFQEDSESAALLVARQQRVDFARRVSQVGAPALFALIDLLRLRDSNPDLFDKLASETGTFAALAPWQQDSTRGR
jgi:hypothetical protein